MRKCGAASGRGNRLYRHIPLCVDSNLIQQSPSTVTFYCRLYRYRASTGTISYSYTCHAGVLCCTVRVFTVHNWRSREVSFDGEASSSSPVGKEVHTVMYCTVCTILSVLCCVVGTAVAVAVAVRSNSRRLDVGVAFLAKWHQALVSGGSPHLRYARRHYRR